MLGRDSIGTEIVLQPFHHDSAAFNPQIARNQNFTIGASFGATRELAFIRAKEYNDGEKCKLYFPQVNNGVFSFGRDANILWKVSQCSPCPLGKCVLQSVLALLLHMQ